MEGQQDSLWPLQQLVKMWSNGTGTRRSSASSRRSSTSYGAEGTEITCSRTAEA